jgi:hypothetical protein
VATESGAATCVPHSAEDFAVAVIQLLSNPDQKANMKLKGLRYVNEFRGYKEITKSLAIKYYKRS